MVALVVAVVMGGDRGEGQTQQGRCYTHCSRDWECPHIPLLGTAPRTHMNNALPKSESFSGIGMLFGPSQGTQPDLRGHPRGPRILEEVQVRLPEIGAVRPEGGLAVAADRPFVLDQECQDRRPVHEDEPGALMLHVAQRD